MGGSKKCNLRVIFTLTHVGNVHLPNINGNTSRSIDACLKIGILMSFTFNCMSLNKAITKGGSRHFKNWGIIAIVEWGYKVLKKSTICIGNISRNI